MTKASLDKLFKLANKRYPHAGSTVSGLLVRGQADNQESIEASLTDYKILPGVREVPTGDFDADPRHMYYDVYDLKRCEELALEISIKGWISPLIVVIDEHGPYVLEGGHRLGAMYLSGTKSFPALVVVGE